MIDANTGRQSRPFEATVSPCSKKPCTLANCPPGLFMSPDGYMGLKTEYANERGGSEAYVVASGEYWWGGEHTHETREKQLVWPCEVRANHQIAGATRPANHALCNDDTLTTAAHIRDNART